MEIIRNVERVQGRTLVLFESGWKVWLLPGMDPGFPLSEGTAVDRRQFEQYLMLQEYPSALEKAVSMLAARARSKKEIMDKLLALRYDPEVAVLVVYKLEKENLLDDEAFSAAARKRNPNISIIPISALTGEGFDGWIGWLENRMKEWKDQA